MKYCLKEVNPKTKGWKKSMLAESRKLTWAFWDTVLGMNVTFIYCLLHLKVRRMLSNEGMCIVWLDFSLPVCVSFLLTVPMLCLTCSFPSGSPCLWTLWTGLLLSQSYKKAIDEVSTTFPWSCFHEIWILNPFPDADIQKSGIVESPLIYSFVWGGEPLQQSQPETLRCTHRKL